MWHDHLIPLKLPKVLVTFRHSRTVLLPVLLVIAMAVALVIPAPNVSAAPGDWTQIGADIDGEAPGDEAGSSVAFSADGMTVAVGAVLNSDSGVFAGHVRVHTFNGTNWVQLGADIDGEAAGDLAGFSVALSADGLTLAVGAQRNDGSAANAGHVRVYGFDGTDWAQIGADIDGEAIGDLSGYSVALSAGGAIVAIGAIDNDGSGVSAGQARVFGYDGTDWVQQGADIDGEAASDRSAWYVDLSADGATLVVAAYLNDGVGANAGHVRVFTYDGTEWSQTGADIDGEFADDRSGYSVAISAAGDTVAIGAIFNDDAATRAGQVRVFTFDGTDWLQQGSDIDGEAAEDRSGWSVALSANGTTVAIGAIGNDDAGLEAGHVRVFTFDGTDWTQQGADIDGEAGDDQSGWSIALSADGSTIAIGAVTNDGNGADSGHVRVLGTGVLNQVPVADPGGPYMTSVGGTVLFDGSASRDGDGDPLTETWIAEGGSVAGNEYTAGTEPGVYEVCVVVNDGTVDSAPACTIVVVDDPAGGFVTGGGRVDSPAGAYLPDPALTGTAKFGFLAKYQPGATMPTGNTGFSLKGSDLDFSSESYQWLIVNSAATSAQLSGEGLIDGELAPTGDPYRFSVWATDGGPGGTDTFRIRIWYDESGAEIDVYDSGVQPIAAGNIKLHE